MLKDDPLGNSYIVHVTPLRPLDLNSNTRKGILSGSPSISSEARTKGPYVSSIKRGGWNKTKVAFRKT